MKISFRGVRFGYQRGTTVLDVPELDVSPGLTLLMGPNGAGKSTLMRLAAGVERPDEGTITIGGANLWTNEIHAREPIAYVPEQPDLTPYATLLEVLWLVARLRHAPPSAAKSALEVVGLSSLGGRTIRELSQGQRRRAVWGAAMIGEPRVLLLDEPLEALDVEMRRALIQWVGSAVERGATVLVSTHDVAAFERWAVGTVRLDAGRIVG